MPLSIEQFIKQRAMNLTKYPRMWAATKEAYINSFTMLAEMAVLPGELDRQSLMSLYSPIRYGSGIKGAEEPVTDEFAKEVSDIFYKMFPTLEVK